MKKKVIFSLLIGILVVNPVIFTANGQFTLTGFPYALRETRNHDITCNYPGASDYWWTTPAGKVIRNAKHTMIVPGSQTDPEGLWQCDALVNGVTKTVTANFFAYCNGVYETDVTSTTPAIGSSFTMTCKVLSASGGRQFVFLQRTVPGDKSHKLVASIREPKCTVNVEQDNRICVPTCDISSGDVHFNIVINQVRTSDMGYWRWYISGPDNCYSDVVQIGIISTGLFKLTGFPSALKYSRHKITCFYPSASTYSWTTPKGVILNGAEQTLASAGNFAAPEGLWKCSAVVGGVTKTVDANLFVYCTGMYETSVTSSNPSIGSKIELKGKVTNPAGSSIALYRIAPGSAMRTYVAYIEKSVCKVHRFGHRRRCAEATSCQTDAGPYYLNLTIDEASSSDNGYWRCYESGKNCASKPLMIKVGAANQPTKTATTSATIGPVKQATVKSSSNELNRESKIPLKIISAVAAALITSAVISICVALRAQIIRALVRKELRFSGESHPCWFRCALKVVKTCCRSKYKKVREEERKLVPPIAPTLDGWPAGDTLKEGKTFSITCKADSAGGCVDSFEVYCGDTKLDSTGEKKETYTVAAVALANAGDYKCKAINIAGSAESTVYKLTVTSSRDL